MLVCLHGFNYTLRSKCGICANYFANTFQRRCFFSQLSSITNVVEMCTAHFHSIWLVDGSLGPRSLKKISPKKLRILFVCMRSWSFLEDGIIYSCPLLFFWWSIFSSSGFWEEVFFMLKVQHLNSLYVEMALSYLRLESKFQVQYLT